MFTGICLALKRQIETSQFREKVLDAIDQRLESEEFNFAVRDYSASDSTETRGVVLPAEMASRSPAERQDFVRTIGMLDPALQAMYEQSFQQQAKKDDDDLPEPEL